MEFRYRTSKGRKKNRLKSKPFIILLLSLAIVIAGAFWFIIRSDGYDKYRHYDEDNKSYGELTHYEKDSDKFFISFYYPKTDNKNLNSIIDGYWNNYLDNQQNDNEEKDILYMDYSINEVFDQYVNMTINIKRYNQKEEIVDQTNKIICYDTQKNQILTVKDVLRRNYKVGLNQIKNINDIEDNSTNVVINKKNMIIYTDDNLSSEIKINYEDNKDLIKLANKNIPSNAPLDVKQPAKQPEVDPNKKMVAFTLDDGPHKTNTMKVVEMFEKYDGRATFFQLGKNINEYPDIVKSVYEHGFEIASHSWDHPDLRKLDGAGLQKQVEDTQNIIFKITGDEPSLIRPPYGAFNSTVKDYIHNEGMEIVMWSVDTEDWKLKDANKIKDVIVSSAYDGAVILLHDIHTFSIEGLEMALEELSNSGYQFVTLSTLKEYKELKTVLR